MNFELKNMILTYTKHFLMKKKALINQIMKSFFQNCQIFIISSWVAFLTHTFPCLCFGCQPKARVVTNIVTHVKGEEANVQKLVLNGIFTWWQDLKISAFYVERSFTCCWVLDLWQEFVNFKNEIDKEETPRLFGEEFHTLSHIFLCIENAGGL